MLMGSDIWEIQDYSKKSLEELIVDDKLVAYREASPAFLEAVEETFY